MQFAAWPVHVEYQCWTPKVHKFIVGKTNRLALPVVIAKSSAVSVAKTLHPKVTVRMGDQ
jgi:hypothetical protein